MIRGRTYYQILMVDWGADEEIINVVYRKLAQRFHPDRDPSPAARTKMLEINQAWDVLKDPVKRAAYDAELAQRRDRRNTDKLMRKQADVPYGEAGPPPGTPSGTILDFGRYRGWTLGQIARVDRDFLEWLERMPAGRQYQREIAGDPADAGPAKSRGPSPRLPALAHGDALEDAQAEGDAHQRRAAVGDERQRDARDGHDPEDHADVDQDLEEQHRRPRLRRTPGRRDPSTRQPTSRTRQMSSDEQQQHDRAAHEAELLGEASRTRSRSTGRAGSRAVSGSRW